MLVPSGTFTMGSSQNEPGHVDDEEPQHKVIISQSFAVGRHAVTRAQFAAFVKATKYKADNANEGSYWAPSWREPGIRQDGSHPVVCVSWDDAKAYASWLAQATGKRYRLLSEAEREYVTRAGTKTPYWCGSIMTAQANFDNAYVDSEKHDPESSSILILKTSISMGITILKPGGTKPPRRLEVLKVTLGAFSTYTATFWSGAKMFGIIATRVRHRTGRLGFKAATIE